LIEWFQHAVPVSAPMSAGQSTFAVEQSFPTGNARWMDLPATQTPALQPDGAYYQPISGWYKNKHWWKRNAPIVGGAGGGALIGGLVGGGTGALVGGAAGGGAGYLYKRSRQHHHHHHYRYQ
jgi:hypothetical protein